MDKAVVTIKNYSFNPPLIDIKKGMKVIWGNEDNVPHTIVNDPSGEMFRSETLEMGQSYEYTFNEGGTFSYHCGIHPNMKGQVVVEG